MELKMNEVTFPEVIAFNFEELKKEITEKAELYSNMVYTDATIKEAKADKATLNKFIKVLEDKRKEVKKECLKPYEEFEKQMKELVDIINKPVQLIDLQVKEYEEKQKQEKLEKIKTYWESLHKPEWLKCNSIFDNRWLNATTSMKKVQEAINDRLNQIASDLETLEKLPEFSFEAVEIYKLTLDINKAIAEGQRLADIQKRKLETEAKQAEQAEQEEQEVPKVVTEEVTPAKVVDPESKTDKNWIRFEALLDVEQAMKLKEFFESNDISFRAI